MRIVQIEVIPLRLPLVSPIVVAWGSAPSLGNIVVKITTDDGVTGIGDTQSFPILGSGSQATLVGTIRNELGPVLIGKDPLQLTECFAAMEAAVGSFNFAKHALDMALHDVVAKTLNVPLGVLFGGRVRDVLPTEASRMGFRDADQTIERVRAANNQGFRYIEVKMSGVLADDVRLIARFREAVGRDVQLKVDPNGSYTFPAAKVMLRELEAYVDVVEQPLPAWDLDGMRRLREHTAIPIVLDESATSVEAIMTAVRMGACDGVHVKPIRLGGLRNAWRAITVLEAAGLIYLPGAMAASGIGMAAVNHLYAAAPTLHRGVPGSSAKYYSADTILDPAPIGPEITVPAGPGIGVELDEDNLKRFRVADL